MRLPLRFFLLVLIGLVHSGCAQQEARINGVSFVAAGGSANQEHVQPVADLGANYAAVMPFGFIRNTNSPTIIHNTERQWFGETRDGAKQYIQELRKQGLKVMIKPQIWIARGEFTGYLKMSSEADWKTLEDSYTSFIMEYADLAREVKAEVLCIGTELEQFVVNRPEFWNNLIEKIKATYKGKLTYAANWDEYKRVPFWEALDFVGVDAYFPISEAKTPTVDEALEGWQKWVAELSAVSTRVGRPIIFTEYGYRSVDYTGKEPWRSDGREAPVNLQAQVNATEALFKAVQDQPWFAGGFVWKWFIWDDKVGGPDNNQFTPQNKPVEQVIKKYYSGE